MKASLGCKFFAPRGASIFYHEQEPRAWAPAPREGRLLILDGGLGGAGHAHAIGGEDVGSDFSFGAVGGDFFAVPEEADSGGVAGLDDDLAVGANGSVGGSDESFVADAASVGRDGDPGVFRGADDQS